ncbi:hypothetical protein Natoc_3021 [Natronococcus occultus SP4]|uniref:Glycosyltransferase RgtA/B/C/D-like domain-containing protein n=2 Tax=Natronococcus occultus TaxID=29288 RepID=L0K2J3_9EURY|nr:hypothetical protein Natoc_3021 [Natronococcus occultus SP4]
MKALRNISTNTVFLSTSILILAILGITLSTFYNNIYVTVLPITLLLGVGVFTLLSFQGPVSEFSFKRTFSNTLIKAVICIYFINLSALNIVYYNNGNERVLAVHILTLLLYLLTVSLVVMIRSSSKRVGFVILTGAVHRATIYFSSQTHMGVDIFRHVDHVTSILESGSLSSIIGSRYYYAPFYHIYTAVSNQILGTEIHTTLFLIFTISMVVVFSTSIYIMTNIFWRPTFALIASILYLSADSVILWSISPQTTSLGLFFSLLSIYSLIRYIKSSNKIYLLLMTSLLLFTASTHQVSLFATFIIISSYVLFYNFYSEYPLNRSVYVMSISLLVFFLDSIVTRTQPGGATFFDQRVFVTFRSLTSGTGRTEHSLPSDPQFTATGAAALNEVHIMGLAILFILSIAGVLYYLSLDSHGKNNHLVVTLGGLVVVISFFTFAAPAIGIDLFMASRWFAFLHIPLVILATLGIFAVVSVASNALSSNNKKMLFIISLLIIICPYLILMGGNHEGAYDDPVFDSAPGAERWMTTETERELYKHASHYRGDDSDVLGDRRSDFPYQYYNGEGTETIQMEYQNPNSIIEEREGDLILYREYLDTNHPTYTLNVNGDRHNVHGPIPINKIDNRNYGKLYNNNKEGILIVINDVEG